jgi:hypothetical protein
MAFIQAASGNKGKKFDYVILTILLTVISKTSCAPIIQIQARHQYSAGSEAQDASYKKKFKNKIINRLPL